MTSSHSERETCEKPSLPQPRPERTPLGANFGRGLFFTMRMQMRRFTRLTMGFSRKLRNLKAAVALYFAHYNFCRVHGALRGTPAMAASISDRVWSLEELVNPPR